MRRNKKAQEGKGLLSGKSGQEQKSKIFLAVPKKAQEEMVGFALIIVIVAVIMLVFLGSYLKKAQNVSQEDYEATSFVQAALSYTTECKTSLKNLTIQDLIFDCINEGLCNIGNENKESCEVLNQTIKEMLDSSWKVGLDDKGEEYPIKGYRFSIISEEKTIILFEDGSISPNSRTGIQDFAKGNDRALVEINAYY